MVDGENIDLSMKHLGGNFCFWEIIIKVYVFNENRKCIVSNVYKLMDPL